MVSLLFNDLQYARRKNIVLFTPTDFFFFKSRNNLKNVYVNSVVTKKQQPQLRVNYQFFKGETNIWWQAKNRKCFREQINILYHTSAYIWKGMALSSLSIVSAWQAEGHLGAEMRSSWKTDQARAKGKHIQWTA